MGSLRSCKRAARPEVIEPKLSRKASKRFKCMVPVPQTDTGRRVENTKVIERTLVKEFGKIDP